MDATNIIKFESNTEIDHRAIEQEGRRIYNTNVFMRSLTNIMENPEFSDLFDQYFDSWDNIELFVLFAKVYQSYYKTMSYYEWI